MIKREAHHRKRKRKEDILQEALQDHHPLLKEREEKRTLDEIKTEETPMVRSKQTFVSQLIDNIQEIKHFDVVK